MKLQLGHRLVPCFGFRIRFPLGPFGIDTKSDLLRAPVLVLWALVPPVLFWCEYFWFAPDIVNISQPSKKLSPEDLELLKNKLAALNDFRQVSIAIWVAFATILGIIYTHPVSTSS